MPLIENRILRLIIHSGNGEDIALIKDNQTNGKVQLYQFPERSWNGNENYDEVMRQIGTSMGLMVNGYLILPDFRSAVRWGQVGDFSSIDKKAHTAAGDVRWVKIEEVKNEISDETIASMPEPVKRYFGIS